MHYREIVAAWYEIHSYFSFSFFFFFFHCQYSPLWALACRTMSFHFFLSATNCLHLLTPNTWRSLSTSSFHLFLGLPLLLVPSNSWVKIFSGILSSSILPRWPNQLMLIRVDILRVRNLYKSRIIYGHIRKIEKSDYYIHFFRLLWRAHRERRVKTKENQQAATNQMFIVQLLVR